MTSRSTQSRGPGTPGEWIRLAAPHMDFARGVSSAAKWLAMRWPYTHESLEARAPHSALLSAISRSQRYCPVSDTSVACSNNACRMIRDTNRR